MGDCSLRRPVWLLQRECERRRLYSLYWRRCYGNWCNGAVTERSWRRQGGRGVPHYAEAVHVEQFVAGCDFMFGCYLVLVVREELGDRELVWRGRETRCEKSASKA